jgi:hypothetical protein
MVMKNLVFGAGPGGSLYAAELSAVGEDVTRLDVLRTRGVVLEHASNGRLETLPVPVTGAFSG